MRKRINEDYYIDWAVTVNGEPISLVGMDLQLTLRDPSFNDTELSFTHSGNVITADFPHDLQREIGVYHLTLWVNRNKRGQSAVDLCNAFELVARSCDESEIDEPGIDHITLPSANLEIGHTGKPGDNGATFTPHVSEEGVLSWTNDRGLENPKDSNIKGRPGAPGTSVTHEFRGTELFVTSASGTTSADLKGDKGDSVRGPRGYSGNLNWPKMYINDDLELITECSDPTDMDRIYVDEDGDFCQVI